MKVSLTCPVCNLPIEIDVRDYEPNKPIVIVHGFDNHLISVIIDENGNVLHTSVLGTPVRPLDNIGLRDLLKVLSVDELINYIINMLYNETKAVEDGISSYVISYLHRLGISKLNLQKFQTNKEKFRKILKKAINRALGAPNPDIIIKEVLSKSITRNLGVS